MLSYVSVPKSAPYLPGVNRARMPGWQDQDRPRDGAMLGASRTCDSWRWSSRPRPGRRWWGSAAECACWWRIARRSNWGASSSTICGARGGNHEGGGHDALHHIRAMLTGDKQHTCGAARWWDAVRSFFPTGGREVGVGGCGGNENGRTPHEGRRSMVLGDKFLGYRNVK